MADNYDESDLRLVHALQIVPRAPWAQLAPPLGLSAATVGRRWAAIVDRGDAWISGYITAGRMSSGAIVEVDCVPDAVSDAAADMARLPTCLSIEVTSGGRDLLVTLVTRSIPDLSNKLEILGRTTGVRRVRGNLITSIFASGASWRLDALAPGQEEAIRRLAAPTPSGRVRQLDQLDEMLSIALSRDGRASAAELAQSLSVSINTVRRRVSGLLDSRVLEIRCDVTRAVSGHELAVTLWLVVPPQDLVGYARRVSRMREIRLVVSVAGPYNLLIAAWLRHATDLPDFESRLTHDADGVRISDRSVVLRTVKHVGRLLDDSGRVCAAVPVDVWN